ncbi:Phosphatidylinositol 4-phosphate 5-kinase its3 [Smittium culicis]|uniref:Phosphatidylinositol 4-phosphate 5-kinase its3 n=1 Tax=Smittium culicis TaxID=133412 RepID=A0A1R1YEK4_9FUNG|nr:Phosphatidylinositol 4-phosphate 5-kinase its3 [Smittium culicis]
MKLLLQKDHPPIASNDYSNPTEFPISQQETIKISQYSASTYLNKLSQSSSEIFLSEFKSLDSADSNQTKNIRDLQSSLFSNRPSASNKDAIFSDTDLSQDIYFPKSHNTKKLYKRSKKSKPIPISAGNLSPDISKLAQKKHFNNNSLKNLNSLQNKLSHSTNSIILKSKATRSSRTLSYSSSGSSKALYSSIYDLSPNTSTTSLHTRRSYRKRSANKLKSSSSFDQKRSSTILSKKFNKKNLNKLSLDFKRYLNKSNSNNLTNLSLDFNQSSINLNLSLSNFISSPQSDFFSIPKEFEYNIDNRLAPQAPISNTSRMLIDYEKSLSEINISPKLELVGPNFNNDDQIWKDSQDTANKSIQSSKTSNNHDDDIHLENITINNSIPHNDHLDNQNQYLSSNSDSPNTPPNFINSQPQTNTYSTQLESTNALIKIDTKLIPPNYKNTHPQISNTGSIPLNSRGPIVKNISATPDNENKSTPKLISSENRVASLSANNNKMYGVKIGMDHANYVLMYNMLTGIRVSVSRCMSKLKKNVSPADFKASHKYSFDVVGDEQVPKLGCYDFKFKDYAPVIFSKIRSIFNLSGTDYLISLTDRYILSEVGSSGKSGSFFYYSQDLRFIIKTVSKTEHKFMRVILKDYYEYLKLNPNTLLSRIYGLHRIKMPRGKKLHFIVMNNLFPPAKFIHNQFDLKGSFLGRRTLKHDQENPNTNKKESAAVCLKDLDWVDLGKKLQIGPSHRNKLAEQLAKDAGLLMRLKIMDYSLLVGIHDLNLGNSFKESDISTKRRQTLSLFDPNITDLPLQMNSLSRVNTMRNKVVRTDPIAVTIPAISENIKRINTITNSTTSQNATGLKHSSANNEKPLNFSSHRKRNNSVDDDNNDDNDEDSYLPNPKSNFKKSNSVNAFKRADKHLLLTNSAITNTNPNTQSAIDNNPTASYSNLMPEAILMSTIQDLQNEENEIDLEGGIQATNLNNESLGYVYYLGVIDILTPYNSKKRAESFFKSIWYSKKEEISAVNPTKYATRFLKFIYGQFDTATSSNSNEKISDDYLDELLENFIKNSAEIKSRKY